MISLKQRFTIYFSILVSALLAIVLITVYMMFAQFRKNEFKQRLEEKAISTVALLADLNVSKQDVLTILDANLVDKLYINRILVFGKDTNLIYSNVSGAALILSTSDLQSLNKEGSFFVSEKQMDRYGIRYKYHDNNEFYVLISAEDISGHRHLWYLRYLLLGAFIVGTSSVIFLARSLSGRILLPLKQIQQRITDISEKKLHIRLDEKRNDVEINKLAHAFNEMMDRIDSSYKQQKEFTDNASHELRTPITRIIMQVQNLITFGSHDEKTKLYLDSIMMDSNQVADTISSLLLLSRIDSDKISGILPSCRLDEIIFDAIQFISKTYPDVHIHFNIENLSDSEVDMEIKGDSNLLKIVFINLFKNAYLYSSDKLIHVNLIQGNAILKVAITNNGEIISHDDRHNLFKAFARGKNSQNIQGTGLGLRITERILNHHNAHIEYEVLNGVSNCFTVFFKF